MIMKIQKKVESTTTPNVNTDKCYSDATKSIKCAIDSLGKAAVSGDTRAKEAIANLSVIMLDMKK